MKAAVSFLSRWKGFDHKQIQNYGHGFLIAAHVREKLKYVLYASQRYPAHADLSEHFLRHHSEYEILGGWGILIHRGEIKLYPLSFIWYIPMHVSRAILPLLQEKLESLGISENLWIKSHDDEIKNIVKDRWGDWSLHEKNFSN